MLSPFEPEAADAVFTPLAGDGIFDPDIAKYLGELGQARPCVVLAFPPKAAGTFLRSAAISAIGGQLVRTVQAQGGRDATTFYLADIPSLLHKGRSGSAPGHPCPYAGASREQTLHRGVGSAAGGDDPRITGHAGILP